MSSVRYSVMVEEWQTEDEIFTYWVQAEAYDQARYLADTYGMDVDVYEENGEDVTHYVVSPSTDSKPTRNYYWDTKGKHQFAAMMED